MFGLVVLEIACGIFINKHFFVLKPIGYITRGLICLVYHPKEHTFLFYDDISPICWTTRLPNLIRAHIFVLFLFVFVFFSQNVFSVSIGNLPPRANVLIKITYVTELTVEGGRLAFTLLGSVAPWKRKQIKAKYEADSDASDAVHVDASTQNR